MPIAIPEASSSQQYMNARELRVPLESFAIHLASRDGYVDNILPSGLPIGSPEEALDCAASLYLGDPTTWLTEPSTN